MAKRQLNFDDGKRPSAGEARARCREKYNAEFVVHSSTHSTRKFHIPDGDETEPLCPATLTENDWRRVPILTFPQGYNEWCTDCLAREFPERSNINVGIHK